MAACIRVLLADDDAAVRAVFRRFLEGHGCVVWEATDGADALARILAADLDVVISDLDMPALDGLGLWRRVGPARPELRRRWLVISAHALPGELASAGVLYLQKPADLEAIWAAVRVAAG